MFFFLFVDLVFCSFRGLVSNNAISSYSISCISAGGNLIRYSSYLRKQEVTEEEKAERRCP